MLSDIRDIVAVKRDGGAWTRAHIDALVQAIANGNCSDAQIAAMTMAVYCRGMDFDECAAMTSAMANSGRTIDLDRFELDGPVVDKHSTGGLGDIVSLVLAPMLAACGLHVPMISGRALGHTGGTLDKLETIPGLNIFPEPARFEEIVAREGLAIVGQTAELVPADRRIYAVRDQTGTVASMPLIVSSILSKKVAERLDALVIDLKVGNGAFMQTTAEAEPLAKFLSGVASALGLKCGVIHTEMNQPLAPCVGDGVEMREALAFLRGDRRACRLSDVIFKLAEELLSLSGTCANRKEARQRLQSALDRGEASERFQRMVAALGGPADILEQPDIHVRPGKVRVDILSDHSGRLAAIDCKRLGTIVHEVITRGKKRDPSVGITDIRQLGDSVSAADILGVAHADETEAAESMAAAVREVFTIQ